MTLNYGLQGFGLNIVTGVRWRGGPESFERKRDGITSEPGGDPLGQQRGGGRGSGGVGLEALMMAKCLWFAGSDVLQWIAQRLWISNLGENSSGTLSTRTKEPLEARD